MKIDKSHLNKPHFSKSPNNQSCIQIKHQHLRELAEQNMDIQQSKFKLQTDV